MRSPRRYVDARHLARRREMGSKDKGGKETKKPKKAAK
jgi:hypothetical protein